MSTLISMATWRYKKPDKSGYRGSKALVKYVTFCEDAHQIIPEDGQERWHNVGRVGHAGYTVHPFALRGLPEFWEEEENNHNMVSVGGLAGLFANAVLLSLD